MKRTILIWLSIILFIVGDLVTTFIGLNIGLVEQNSIAILFLGFGGIIFLGFIKFTVITFIYLIDYLQIKYVHSKPEQPQWIYQLSNLLIPTILTIFGAIIVTNNVFLIAKKLLVI
ncbi:MAG: hypothetical protein ACLFUH_01205 [Bacteroidales bacterium]